MILRKELCRVLRLQDIDSWGILTRFYSSKVDLRNLQPMILKRIEEREKKYRFSDVNPLAHEVLNARGLLIRGVSALLKVFRVKTCKFCSEVYIGEKGHLIPTCHGYRRRGNNRLHEWVDGSIDDILVPVETSDHSCLFRDDIKQHQRIPAVVKLCYKTGAEPQDEKTLHPFPGSFGVHADNIEAESVWDHDLCLIANGTLMAWEVVRSGVGKLLMSYPTQICEHCSKVHVGSGHKAQPRGVYEHESLRGLHLWRKAEVDDLVPPKIVWHRRSQDPPILVEKGREFYGHAPAVVSLCAQAGGIPPVKYNCMMKVQGLPGPTE